MKNIEKEIVELHQFFQDWFNGQLPQDENSFARFADVMAEGFHMVAPNGRITPREPLVKGLYNLYGRSQTNPGKIWIQNIRLQYQQDDLILATYEEWQSFAAQTTARISSVLFRQQPDAPQGVVWLHLHETWMERNEAES